jgi:GAF domain-containing protein
MSVAIDNSADLVSQAAGLLSGERDRIANAANLSALIFQSMDRLNWAGFYFFKGGELVVGPFQGKPACVRIPLGRGVCGRAAESREVIRVFDVDAFDDHIVCDADSRSEIVLPLVKDSELIGVLDLDSPVKGRFSDADQAMLEQLARIYVDSID